MYICIEHQSSKRQREWLSHTARKRRKVLVKRMWSEFEWRKKGGKWRKRDGISRHWLVRWILRGMEVRGVQRRESLSREREKNFISPSIFSSCSLKEHFFYFFQLFFIFSFPFALGRVSHKKYSKKEKENCVPLSLSLFLSLSLSLSLSHQPC